MEESSTTEQEGLAHFSWYVNVCTPRGAIRALPSSSLRSTAGSRERFVARPTVSKLKLRASTVTASGVNPLLVIENSPRHFLPHSTIIGDTVCAEAARLKHTICSATKHTTLFIFRFPLQEE